MSRPSGMCRDGMHSLCVAVDCACEVPGCGHQPVPPAPPVVMRRLLSPQRAVVPIKEIVVPITSHQEAPTTPVVAIRQEVARPKLVKEQPPEIRTRIAGTVVDQVVCLARQLVQDDDHEWYRVLTFVSTSSAYERAKVLRDLLPDFEITVRRRPEQTPPFGVYLRYQSKEEQT